MRCNICGKELREGPQGCASSPTPHLHYDLKFADSWVSLTVCVSHSFLEITDWLEGKVRWVDDKERIERLKEIIKIAHKLGWIYPPDKTPYPLMQLSEVEKCMIAMVNDFELGRMRKWEKGEEG